MSIRLHLHPSRLESVCAALVLLDEPALRLNSLRPHDPDALSLPLRCEFPDHLEHSVLRALLGATCEHADGDLRIEIPAVGRPDITAITLEAGTDSTCA